MANTSLTLGKHWENFIKEEIATGRYASASEIVRDALRCLEEKKNKQKLDMLRAAIIEGEQSDDIGSLDMAAIIREAKS